MLHLLLWLYNNSWNMVSVKYIGNHAPPVVMKVRTIAGAWYLLSIIWNACSTCCHEKKNNSWSMVSISVTIGNPCSACCHEIITTAEAWYLISIIAKSMLHLLSWEVEQQLETWWVLWYYRKTCSTCCLLSRENNNSWSKVSVKYYRKSMLQLLSWEVEQQSEHGLCYNCRKTGFACWHESRTITGACSLL